MITLINFLSSLTILLLSAKTYVDLQDKILEAETLIQKLKTKETSEEVSQNTPKDDDLV